jgi:hypothetical protein
MERKERPPRQMDGVGGCVTHHVLTDKDTTDQDIYRNLVLGEGKWTNLTMNECPHQILAIGY